MTIGPGHDGEVGLVVAYLDGELHVAGEIDAATCTILRDAIDAHLSTDVVRLDMADVTFIDSTGLQVLAAARAVRDVTLVRPSDVVRRAVEITGLDRILSIE